MKKLGIGILLILLAFSLSYSGPGSAMIKAKELALSGNTGIDGIKGVCKQDKEVKRCVLYYPSKRVVAITESYPSGITGMLMYSEDHDAYAAGLYKDNKMLDQLLNFDHSKAEESANELLEKFMKMSNAVPEVQA